LFFWSPENRPEESPSLGSETKKEVRKNMKGKPEFRVDMSTDFCIIGDNGLPYWVKEDEALELVTDPEQARRLLETAPAYGYSVNSEDVLKDTSWAKRGRELTVGSMLGEPQDPPGAVSTEPPAPHGEDVLRDTSWMQSKRGELTVGGLLGQRQSPPREEDR